MKSLAASAKAKTDRGIITLMQGLWLIAPTNIMGYLDGISDTNTGFAGA